MLTRWWISALVGIAVLLAVPVSSRAAAGDPLLGGQSLTSGQTLTSPDGHYQLVMQGDGNLVLYEVNGSSLGRALWFTGNADARHLRGLIRSLRGRTYRAGDRLLIVISKRGFRPERISVRIRFGALPRVRLL